MGPFEALAIASMGYGLYNSLFNKPDGRPNLPSLLPPSPEPAREFYDFTNWQNTERNNLLAEYYGGTVRDNPMDTRVGAHLGPVFTWDDSGEEYTPGDPNPETTDNIPDWMQGSNPDPSVGNVGTDLGYLNIEMPTTRNEISFTGNIPANKYFATQQRILRNSKRGGGKGFAGDVGNYLKERGFSQGEKAVAQQGAVEEMKKDYTQRDLDIKSRAEDIRSQTLAMLFGEVSDAGPQSAALAANLGNANQMFNQSMMNSYNAAMQQYAYNQNAPMDPLAAVMGQSLPLLLSMYGGMGGGAGVAQTYPAGYGVDPRVSGLTYPIQF